MSSPSSPTDQTDTEASPPHAQHVSRLMLLLEAHWVMTLASCEASPSPSPSPRPSPRPDSAFDHTVPYCTPLYYALDQSLDRTEGQTQAHASPALIFTSNPDSAHGRHLDAGPTPVGAAIYLETQELGQIRGVQMRGWVQRAEPGSEHERLLREQYLGRHPIAADMLSKGSHRLYELRLGWAKLTDNRLGFGQHPVVHFDRPQARR